MESLRSIIMPLIIATTFHRPPASPDSFMSSSLSSNFTFVAPPSTGYMTGDCMHLQAVIIELFQCSDLIDLDAPPVMHERGA